MASNPKTRQAVATIGREIGEETVLNMVAEGKSQRAIAVYVSEKLGRELSQYYIYNYLHRDEEASSKYRAAKLAAAANAVGTLQEITQDVLDGKRDPASVKTASDNLKWTASRLDPSSFGDKMAVDVAVTDITALHLASMRARMQTVSVVETERARDRE